MRRTILACAVIAWPAVQAHAAVTIKVLGPDGKPIVGAKVVILTYPERKAVDDKGKQQTDANGEYVCDVIPVPREKSNYYVVVTPPRKDMNAAAPIEYALADKKTITVHLTRRRVPMPAKPPW
ncbi:hypothetical protein AYO40_03105 [Planctomycetaceae bacterium SCGC AG-212-D15]|nr:hypothetical protein AYO40_03105 [Planctomycetaceae bacterium SCGC AG-212-D15]